MQEPGGYVTDTVTKQLRKLIVVTSNEIVGIANRASLARFPEPFSHHKFFPRTHPA
jgi:hypothetical protein